MYWHFSTTLDLFHQNAKTTSMVFTPLLCVFLLNYSPKPKAERWQNHNRISSVNPIFYRPWYRVSQQVLYVVLTLQKSRLTLYEIYGGKYVTFCESWRNQAQFCTLWDFYDYDDGWAQWLCSPLTQAHLAKIDQLLLKAKGGKWESLVLGSSSTSRETTLGGK